MFASKLYLSGEKLFFSIYQRLASDSAALLSSDIFETQMGTPANLYHNALQHFHTSSPAQSSF